MTASCHKGSLLAYIHAGYGAVVETFVNVLENDLLVCYVVDEVGDLRDKFVEVEGGDIVVGERYCDYVLL